MGGGVNFFQKSPNFNLGTSKIQRGVSIFQKCSNLNYFALLPLGEPSLKKNGKIWEKFPIRLDPPSPSDISDFFEFQTFLKIADPPLGSNSDIFDFQTFLIKVILQNNCKIIEIGTFLKNIHSPWLFPN